MKKKLKLTCYHGTSIDSVDNIIKHGYRKSEPTEWFGPGIYFFESFDVLCDGYIEARDWAKNVKKFNNWAIFKAIVESNKFIDIAFIVEHKKKYDSIKREALARHTEAGKKIEEFNERTIFHEMQKLDIDFIRALVDSKKYLGYYSYVIRRPQLQVCVKEAKAIKYNVLINSKWDK